jgi:hypothetical protein
MGRGSLRHVDGVLHGFEPDDGAAGKAVGVGRAIADGVDEGDRRSAVAVDGDAFGPERGDRGDEADADDHDVGRQPLAAGQYFGRLAQSVIAGLGFRTGDGALFDTDFRLRPWGNKGPIATRLTALSAYFDTEAWTWEHMALTRARVIAGNGPLRAQVEGLIACALCRRRDPVTLAADIAAMRARIAGVKGTAPCSLG